MEQICIASEEHPFYKDFVKLYIVAFPLYEQRTALQQRWAFQQQSYSLVVFCEEGRMIGFISAWQMTGCVYVEHFAIMESYRGKGFGNRILKSFVETVKQCVVLEIDPVCDALTAARLRFYEHCGFVVNPYAHTHPPYREGFGAHVLTVLSTPALLDEEAYRLFLDDLQGVMACPATAL